ncbi:MAG: hypothetical protein RL637_67 [Pseudomonadota bacterium]|jgi:molybdopterin synthase sulfur carrier subunit
MTIQVRYFASLKQQLGRDQDHIDLDTPLTAADIWQQLHPQLPIPSNLLVAINLEYATWSSLVKDQDELAFFPPVTGG